MNLRISINGFRIQLAKGAGSTIHCSNGAGRLFTTPKKAYMTDVEEDHIKIHFEFNGDFGYYMKITFVNRTKVTIQNFYRGEATGLEGTWDFARYKEEGCYMRNGLEIV
jgi:hypothetical protein